MTDSDTSQSPKRLEDNLTYLKNESMEVVDQDSGTSGTDLSDSDPNDSDTNDMEPMDHDTTTNTSADDLLELGLEELPSDALECSNQSQFISVIKPYLIEIYPQATAYAIQSLAIRQFKGLKRSRKRQTELQILSASKAESKYGRGKRNAVKNLSKNVYTGGETMLELDKMLSKRGAKMSSKKPPRPLLPQKRHSRFKHTQATGVGISRESIRYKKGTKECDESEGSVGGGSEVEPNLKRQKITDKSDQEDTDPGESVTKECPQCHKIFHEEHSLTRHIKLVHDGKIDTVQTKPKLSEDSCSNSSSEAEDELYSGQQGEHSFSEEEPVRSARVKNTSDGRGGEDSDHQDHCFFCKDGGELLCCDRCPKTFHVYCLNPPMNDIPDGEWGCAWCTAQPLSKKVETILYWRNYKGPDWDELPEHLKARPNREYFVKWRDTSYWHCSWVGEVEMEVYESHLLRNYMKRVDMTTPPPLETLDRRHRKISTTGNQEPIEMEEVEELLIRIGIRPEWLHVHRIIDMRVTRGGRQYLTKWRDLGYEHCSWEYLTDREYMGAEEGIKHYTELKESVTSGKKAKKKRICTNPKIKYEADPDFVIVTGGRLHPYQLEGLNWLRFSWANQIDTILADEMGLGKTIQTIVFLNSLVKEGHSSGPFLISAPLTTIVNWEREFEFWAPDLYVVNYTGQKSCRQVIREHELSFQENVTRRAGKPGRLRAGTQVKFHAILTSYELVSNDSTLLQSIDWAVLVVDEAHRLRNNRSLFFRTLTNFHIDYKLLLTGTPLQNNLEELFYLLNFLNRIKFRDCEEFLEQFQDMSKEEQVLKLHDLLGPHLLRRLKADVLKDIPSKSELIVRVDMEPLQKKVYKLILTRNFEALNTKMSAQNVSLITIMMDLKKCCNHPYLFAQPSEEAQVTATGLYEFRGLVDACGKLKLMEKMLARLKERGHRVLIFSQMTKLLDLLEDFLENKGYKYERIDGGVTGLDRQACIDRFNDPESETFVFLLSTRAGGLGINLATADTVIIYDSDWNPHNDIQAFSRAHRIGQTNKVMIYRFVTRNTVEERITEVAKRKMMLTHLIVRPGMGSASQNVLTKRELDDILKFGTEELFKDDQVGKEGEESARRIVYDSEEIDRLLDRSQEGVGEAKFGANDYLSSFKVATFALKDQEQETIVEQKELSPEPEKTESTEDVVFWERVLRHHYIMYKEQEEAKWGKGKRTRKTVNYSEQGTKAKEKKDSDYMELSPDSSSLDEEGGDSGDVRGRVRKGKSLRSYKPALPLLMENIKGTLHVFGFNPRQRKSFLNAIQRYGMPPLDAYSSHWMPRDLRGKPRSHFDAYVNMFMRHLCEPETASPTFLDGVPKEGLVRNAVLTRMGLMRLVRNKVEQYKDVNCTYWIESTEARTFLGITMTTESADANQPIESVPEDVKMETTRDSDSMCDNDNEKSEIVAQCDTSKMEIEQENVAEKDTEPTQPLSNTSNQSENNSANEMEQEPNAKETTGTMDDNIPEPTTSHVTAPLSNTSTSSEQTEHISMGFMFNIADGGFTELHSYWSGEKTEKPSPYKWGRRHDYWLLRGVLTHGYARWHEICNDKKLDILNMPFPNNPAGTDQKFKFIPRRFKLLEQALAVEEQLNRASSKGLIQDPGQPIMFLHARYTELECLADGHQALLPAVANGNKYAYTLLKKALVKMEELLNEMRQDINKLPAQLANQSSVTQKLQLSDNNILTRLTTGIPSIQAGKQNAPTIQTTNASIQRFKDSQPQPQPQAQQQQQQQAQPQQHNMLNSPKRPDASDKQEEIIKTDLSFLKGHKIVSQKGQQTVMLQAQPLKQDGQQYQQAVIVQNPSMIHQSGQTIYLTQQSGTSNTSQPSGSIILQATTGQQGATSYVLVQQPSQSGQNLVLQPIQQSQTAGGAGGQQTMVVAAQPQGTQKIQTGGQDRQQPMLLNPPMYQSGQTGAQTILMAPQGGTGGYFLAHPQQVGGPTYIIQGGQQKSQAVKTTQAVTTLQPQVMVTSGTQGATQLVVQTKPAGNVAQPQATPQIVAPQQATPVSSTIHID